MLSEELEGGSRLNPETTLYKQAQVGDQEILNTLMERHERLVHYAVYHQQLYGMPYEEAVQAWRFGLWRSILGYGYRQEFNRAGIYWYTDGLGHTGKITVIGGLYLPLVRK